MNLKRFSKLTQMLLLEKSRVASEPEILAGCCVDGITSDGWTHIWIKLCIYIQNTNASGGGLQMTTACINNLLERVLQQLTSLL